MDWDLTIRGDDESIIIKCKSSLTLTLTFPIDYDDRETARLAYKGTVFKFDKLMLLKMGWKYADQFFEDISFSRTSSNGTSIVGF